MRRFWDNKREEESLEEETRTNDGDLKCEEQIIDDVERFGSQNKLDEESTKRIWK